MKATMIFSLMVLGILALTSVYAADKTQTAENMQMADSSQAQPIMRPVIQTDFWDHYIAQEQQITDINNPEVVAAVEKYTQDHPNADFWDKYLVERKAMIEVERKKEDLTQGIFVDLENQAIKDGSIPTDFWDRYVYLHELQQQAVEKYQQETGMEV